MDTFEGQTMGPRILAGRYEVGRLLGAGGMAEVYEGHDRLLARRMAIKILLSQYAHDPAFLERFRREARHYPPSRSGPAGARRRGRVRGGARAGGGARTRDKPPRRDAGERDADD